MLYRKAIFLSTADKGCGVLEWAMILCQKHYILWMIAFIKKKIISKPLKIMNAGKFPFISNKENR